MYWNPNKYLINSSQTGPHGCRESSKEGAMRKLHEESPPSIWLDLACGQVGRTFVVVKCPLGGGKDKILVEYQYGRKSLAQIISFLACLSNKHHQNRVPGGPHFIQILLHNMLTCFILSQLFSVPINLASWTPSFVAWGPFVCSGDGGFGLAQR